MKWKNVILLIGTNYISKSKIAFYSIGNEPQVRSYFWRH